MPPQTRGQETWRAHSLRRVAPEPQIVRGASAGDDRHGTGTTLARCARMDPDRPITRRRHGWLPRSLMLVGVAAVGTAAFADENMSGQRELIMSHCPSAVEGATTRVSDIAEGVIVTVRAPHDPIAQQEIRRRVQFQLEIVDQPERGAIEHTGLGTGSGRYGFCPGMLQQTSLDVEWLSDGAKMTIRADRAEDVPRLQSTTRKRARALAARTHVAAR
jgi:hypothetical protein